MNNDLLLFGIAAIVINSAILYLIIAAASRSTLRAKYEWAQLEMLIKIAKAHGVPEEEISGTMRAAGLSGQ